MEKTRWRAHRRRLHYQPRHLRGRRDSTTRAQPLALVLATLAIVSLLNVVAPPIASASTPSIVTTAISSGDQTTCAVRTGGVAYCWGDNTYGQFGNGTTISSMTPQLVAGNYTWSSISTIVNTSDDTATTCGITTSGAAYCWGHNGSGEVGDGTTTPRLVPTLVSGGYTWKSISVGFVDVCGVTTSNAGYCWGANWDGEIGDGTWTERDSPTLVSGGYSWSEISENSYYTCGVTTSNAGYCWGDNTDGQIGDGTTTQRTSPTAPSGGLSWTQISTGAWGTCGVTTTHAGYCWGANWDAGVGDGTWTERNSPTPISGAYSWSQVFVGGQTNCGLTTGGTTYCWGYNINGQVGNGNTSDQSAPTAISGGETFTSISIGWGTSCGVTNAGVAYCWGRNEDGQLGDRTTFDSFVPAAVNWANVNTSALVAPGGQTSCAIRAGGIAYCWGDNTYGQLGNGTTTSSPYPQPVLGGYLWKSISTQDNDLNSPHSATTCGITTSGAAYCWGDNSYDQLGNGTTTSSYLPSLVSGGFTWASISVGTRDVCGVTTAGAGYCWGENTHGEVGDNTQTPRSSPTAVSGGYTWSVINDGDQESCGVTTSGNGYCWGANWSGEVGDGTSTDRYVPTALSGGITWSSISIGSSDACGLATSGTGYCWGDNAFGQIGDNTSTQRLVPTSVSGGYTFAQISSGGATTCGVTTTGVPYCWGYNNAGEVGDNTTTNRAIPTAVSGGFTFSSINTAMDTSDPTTCGLTTGGLVECWGNNNNYQIGDETTTNSSTPVAVIWPAGKTVTQASPGGLTNCSIVSGNAYCWGNNTYGQIGDGTTIARTAPTLVAGGYTWTSIKTQYDTSDNDATTCGITTSGAAYCWGSNTFGTVGDGTTTQRNTPTLVSGGYTWASISVGWEDVCGVTTAGAGYCWGNNWAGQGGNGTGNEEDTPTLVSGGHTWKMISEGWANTCGVTTTGTGYCWGYDAHGEAGAGTTSQYTTPTAVSGGYTWASISSNADDSCGVTTTGVGYCWGSNNYGDDGDNSLTENNSPVAVSGGYTWATISMGYGNACGLTTAGAGYCWGYNADGENGTNNTTQVKVPTAIAGGLTFASINVGPNFTTDNTNCGITVAGAEYCWGQNSVSQVGDGTTTNQLQPTAVAWNKATSQIGTGGETNCAIKNGAAYCWGNNTYGQIGDGTTTNRTTPTPVSGGYTWVSISSADDTYSTDDVATTCGITTSGAGYCWGGNAYGDVGDGTTTQRTTPTPISGGYTWASISVGATDVCGVTTAGVGYCWGLNVHGQDGNNATTENNTPTAVNGGYTWSSIYTGQNTSCGVTTNDVGYCWGSNTYGSIGDGTTTDNDVPTAVSGGYSWSSITEKLGTSCGVTVSGAGYCWGANWTGGLGDGNTGTQQNAPTAVNGGYTWAQIYAGDPTCGLTTSGQAYCWGDNGQGEVGDGTTTARNVPTAVLGGLTFTTIQVGLDATNDDTNCGITPGGTEYCWGYNNYDQVGDGTATSQYTPTPVVWSGAPQPPSPVSAIAPGGQTNCAIKSGSAYCWGDNTYGQIGDGTTTSHNVPTLVAGGYAWATISTQFDDNDGLATTCGVTTSGTGYCWGSNTYGDVGDGTTTQRLVPTLVSGGHTWASITVGYTDTCGVTTAGAGYCWGWNQYGEDGDNTTTQHTSPTLISGYTWASLSEGYQVTCGVTTTNAGYCWGRNFFGMLGNNTTTAESVPTAVSGAYSWSSILEGQNTTCGVTTTGTGYCWGTNGYYEVGDGTTTQRNVPTAITGGLTWTKVSPGNNSTCGITTTNIGYCWGLNADGEVGDGTTTQRTAPTSVTGGFKFASILSGAEYNNSNDVVCGLTLDGAEYCWGLNNESQVGDQTTTNRDMPTPVNWNNPVPNLPTSLAQYLADGVTSISIGGYSSSTAIFKATVSGPDPSETDSLCVEAIPAADTFQGTATYCGSPVNNGATASATAIGLADATAYKWQAQTVSSAGLASRWVTFNSGSTAFTADSNAPTTGTVYDGSSAGVESQFNNGSLSSLSCNWTGFADSESGLASYDYSIGTSQGGTDIVGWTNVSSATTSVSANSLTLHTSQMYYCNVRVRDVAANISSTISSSGQMVAPTLTFTTSTNAIDFAALSAGDSYTNAQTMTLTTSTNAYSGYVISAYETGAMAYGSNTIADYASPASSPTTWSGTGFGYTVSGGSAAAGFGGGTKYAHFGTSGSPDAPIAHSGPVAGSSISNEQETVTLKIAGSSVTPAGNYATTLKWSCVASY